MLILSRLPQDTTTHPSWTGEKAGLSMEDERIARLMKRYEGFGVHPEAAAATEAAPAAVAEAGAAAADAAPTA